MPIEIYKENTHTEKPLSFYKKAHFKELKVKHRFSMPIEYLEHEAVHYNIAQSINDFPLNNIGEVMDGVLKEFPFPTEDKNFKTDFAMIQRDFPNLTLKEIKANGSLIMHYYAVNFGYKVLQVLKKTKSPIEKDSIDFMGPPQGVRNQWLLSDPDPCRGLGVRQCEEKKTKDSRGEKKKV